MQARDVSFDDIKVGDTVSFDKTWEMPDVLTFAALSGDQNPLHMDEAYAKTTPFGKCVVHGSLVMSSFSTLAGMHLPGKRCLIVSYNAFFKKPVYVDEVLTIHGEVTAKSIATRIIDIKVRISRGADDVVTGDIKALVREQ